MGPDHGRRVVRRLLPDRTQCRLAGAGSAARTDSPHPLRRASLDPEAAREATDELIRSLADRASCGSRDAWFGAARRSRGRAAADGLTLAVRDLAPGDAVLMTTYRSDGDRVAAGEPFVEARTEAAESP